ncbi:SDR family NAD(P)-dependent oxidoreductase [Yinghuangia seranimata]|uniref:SDR family NAD(P)-dependent oxidoreductase n=1 Tax=Yinghuangia seranimata TaxID=408067 RepID=UPI00248BC9AA|nr:SDR family oxidoreductase [Yinghuangia seranimata]MDI2126680.1 SDR family oxidoreductase [Yinghuangia seranimata]
MSGDKSTTALVTGAGRGIGRAVAERLAAEGLAVAVLGRSRESLTDVLDALGDARATAVIADVTDPKAVAAAVAEAEDTLGPLDLVVNNAGRIDQAEVPFWEADLDQWWTVVEANLRGVVNVDHAVLPRMVARRHGRIVNLSSGFAVGPDPHYSAYTTSKTAALRLTDTIAGPLADHGITVFDISPGAVATDMTAGMDIFRGKTDWYDLNLFLNAVVAVAEGHLDPLSGRFLHAGKDDLITLATRAAELKAKDARRLHLRPYGPEDPQQ